MIIVHAKRGEIRGEVIGAYNHLGNEFFQVMLLESMHSTSTAMVYQQRGQSTYRKGTIYDVAKVNIESMIVENETRNIAI